jgi:hypothetical protein
MPWRPEIPEEREIREGPEIPGQPKIPDVPGTPAQQRMITQTTAPWGIWVVMRAERANGPRPVFGHCVER